MAEKFCPVEEVLEPRGSSRTTVILVSAGTTRGLGGTGSRTLELFEELEPFTGPAEESFGEELFAEEPFGEELDALLDGVFGVAD